MMLLPSRVPLLSCDVVVLFGRSPSRRHSTRYSPPFQHCERVSASHEPYCVPYFSCRSPTHLDSFSHSFSEPQLRARNKDAISTPSSHSRALCNMGRLLEDRENTDAALLCFQEASAVDAASAEALCGQAGNLRRRGDLDGAAFYFEGVRHDGFESALLEGDGQEERVHARG